MRCASRSRRAARTFPADGWRAGRGAASKLTAMRSCSSASFIGRTETARAFSLERRLAMQHPRAAATISCACCSRRPAACANRAPGRSSTRGADVPWTGRDRLDVGGFPCPKFALASTDARVTIATSAVVRRRAARAVRHRLVAGRRDAVRERPRRPTLTSGASATGTVRHYMTRDRDGDRYFGLGRQDGTARPARPPPAHARARRARATTRRRATRCTSTGRILIVRDAERRRLWPLLRHARRGHVRPRLRARQLPRLLPLLRDRGRRPRLLPVRRARRSRDVVRKFAELTGPHGVRPALEPRLRQHGDEPDRRAGCAGAAVAVHRRRRAHDVPISAFHFGSGYSSLGKRRYVFTWNRDKFPDAARARRAIRASRHQARRQHQAVPARRSSRLRGSRERSARSSITRGSGTPCVGQFWDGEGAHVDFTNPDGMRWWQESLRDAAARLRHPRLERQQRIRDLGRGRRSRDGFGTPIPIARSRPLQRAADDARDARSADRRTRAAARTFTVTRAGPPGIQRYAQTWSRRQHDVLAHLALEHPDGA